MIYEKPISSVNHGITSSFELLFPEEVSRNHTRRLNAYRKYWLYYLGKHWSYQRDPGEPTITMNYSRRIVDIHTDFTFKKGFQTVIPDDPSTPNNEQEDREFQRYLLEETWKKNSQNLFSMEMGQHGSVTGDVFLRVAWNESDPLEDPYAIVELIPSHLCFPEFGGTYGVDRRQLKRALIVIPVFAETLSNPASGAFFMRRTKTMAMTQIKINAELWTPESVTYFENKQEVEKKPNPLGEVPIVHIPNYPLSGESYGISDLVDCIELNRELNEKVTDVSDIINYHGSPQTIVYGAKLKDLERGVNRIWSAPADARVENLRLDGDLVAANEHVKMLKQSILELTGTPEQVLGKQQAISNTTGVAMQITYLPMIEKRDLKVLTYGHGLRLVNRLIMRTQEIADKSFSDKMESLKKNKYRNEVVFSDPMPQDERRELELTREKLDLRLTSRKRELEKQGMSQAQITVLMKEVEEEMEKEAASLFDAPGPGSGNATFIRGGANETRGEKIDDDLMEK